MNHSATQQYIHLKSPIHSLDVRFKLIGIFVLIFSMAFVTKLILLPIIFVTSLFVAILSRLPFLFIIKRLQLPGVLIVVVALLTLFYTSGTPLIQFGTVAITKEGISSFLFILIRFVSIVFLMVVLFETTPFANLVKAMRTLGLPLLLCDMMVFSYRYIFELWNDFQTMKISMKMRGFKEKGLRSLGTWALLTGTLFIRSYEQSERVYHAMALRGYGHAPVRKEEFEPGRADYIGLSLLILVSVMILVGQYLLEL